MSVHSVIYSVSNFISRTMRRFLFNRCRVFPIVVLLFLYSKFVGRCKKFPQIFFYQIKHNGNNELRHFGWCLCQHLGYMCFK
jgi:hypothetical protein